MSKFKQSAITPEHRGRMGNIVFSENHYGPYDKLITFPINKNTSSQKKVRDSLGNLSHIWSNNLNKAQYEGWRKIANKITYTGASGNKYHPVPRDIFTAFNSNLSNVGLPIKLDPPKKLSVQSFISFKAEIIFDSNNQDIRLFFNQPINEDTRLKITATRAFSNARTFFRHDFFKNIGFIDSGFKSGDSILSLYRSFPDFNHDFVGSFQIAFHIRPVSCSSGYSKVEKEISASVYQTIQ